MIPNFFAEIAAKLRAVMPRIGLTTDLIVGYPGETLELFENTLAFARKMQFARTHVFRYSPRQRTAAEQLRKMMSPMKKKNGGTAHSPPSALPTQEAFAAGDLGQIVNVLVPKPKAHRTAGCRAIPAITSVCSSPRLRALRGQIVSVRLTEILPGGDAFGIRD